LVLLVSYSRESEDMSMGRILYVQAYDGGFAKERAKGLVVVCERAFKQPPTLCLSPRGLV